MPINTLGVQKNLVLKVRVTRMGKTRYRGTRLVGSVENWSQWRVVTWKAFIGVGGLCVGKVIGLFEEVVFNRDGRFKWIDGVSGFGVPNGRI